MDSEGVSAACDQITSAALLPVSFHPVGPTGHSAVLMLLLLMMMMMISYSDPAALMAAMREVVLARY